MYDEARELGIRLMAGSSVPLAQRVPPVDVPAGAAVEEAISIHGGGIESFDFHALEVLQSLVEARAGGETGVSQVELLAGEAFHNAQAAERWSRVMVDAAMAAEEKANFQRLQYPRRPPGRSQQYKTTAAALKPRHALIVHFKDGT